MRGPTFAITFSVGPARLESTRVVDADDLKREVIGKLKAGRDAGISLARDMLRLTPVPDEVTPGVIVTLRAAALRLLVNAGVEP